MKLSLNCFSKAMVLKNFLVNLSGRNRLIHNLYEKLLLCHFTYGRFSK
jgi:hypothetical protein